MFAGPISSTTGQTSKPTIYPNLGLTSTPTNAKFSSDNRYVVSVGHYESFIRVWDVKAERELLTLGIPDKGNLNIFNNSTGLSLSPNDQWLAAARLRTVWIWDFQTKQYSHEIPFPSRVAALAFSPDSTGLLVADTKVH